MAKASPPRSGKAALLPRTSFLARTLGIAALAILTGTGVWLGTQFDWNIREAMASARESWQQLTSPVRATPLFDGSRGITLDQARLQYRQSLQALAQGNAAQALEGFRAIEPVFPGLSAWILLHQAQALGLLGDESAAQERLRTVVARAPEASALHATALYALGQSRLRAHQDDEARRAFRKLTRRFAQSDVGIASLYYLGELAARDAAALGAMVPSGAMPVAQRAFWREYLDRSPEGRFAFEIATALRAQPDPPTPDDCRRIVRGLASHGPLSKDTQTLLACAPLKDVWQPMARAQAAWGDRTGAASTAIQGLALARDEATVSQGLDLLATILPPDDLTPVLAQVVARWPDTPPPGGDAVLWRLSQLDADRAAAYWQAILARYPQGDYAPESSWMLLRRLLRSGEGQAYLDQSARHMRLYPYAQSAAAVQFWRAKLLERRGATHDAITTYGDLLSTYPASYYAFRAHGRLRALKDGLADPRWQLHAGRPLPAASMALDPVRVLEAADAVNTMDPAQRDAAGELLAMGACEDLALLHAPLPASLSRPEPPPSRARLVLESACLRQAQDHASSIRVLRSGLDALARHGDQTALQPRASEMALLYPIHYAPFIAREAARQGVDPLLALSLMREESHFNDMAVSSSRALGLMQLMPATAQEVAGWEGIAGFQPMMLFDPAMNIRLGCRYLKYLSQTLNGQPMPMVGAYNGGPNAMKRWMAQSSALTNDPDQFVEDIPYDQTRDYIKKVFASYWNYRRVYEQAASP